MTEDRARRYVSQPEDFVWVTKQKAFDESDVNRDDDKVAMMTDKSKTKQGTQEAKPDDKSKTKQGVNDEQEND